MSSCRRCLTSAVQVEQAEEDVMSDIALGAELAAAGEVRPLFRAADVRRVRAATLVDVGTASEALFAAGGDAEKAIAALCPSDRAIIAHALRFLWSWGGDQTHRDQSCHTDDGTALLVVMQRAGLARADGAPTEAGKRLMEEHPAIKVE